MSNVTYGFLIVDSEGDDIGEIVPFTDELRENPSLLQEKINEIIKKHEDAIAEDEEEEEEEEDDEDDI